MIFQEWPGGL
jgi:predicted acylesterase/phospholipase RssA